MSAQTLKLVAPQAPESLPPKTPWLPFYPADWRADPKLRACSLQARGLWIEMIGLMHEAGGYLLINGHRPDPIELALQVGATPAEVKKALEELRKNDVNSVTPDGILYSRRLVRKAQRSVINSGNGKLGAEARWGSDGPDQSPIRHDDHNGKRDGKQDGDHDGKTDGKHDGPIDIASSLLASRDRDQEKDQTDARGQFDRFWASYPRKVGKDAAWREWQRIQPSPDDTFTDRAIAVVQREKAGWDNPKYIPHPRTWLHGQRWEDEPESFRADETALSRAHSLLQRYPLIYARWRAGATYRPIEDRDLPSAIDLVSAYEFDERLDEMAEVFLRMDCGRENRPGDVKQFAHMAPECDRLLRGHGR